jgi:arylsulfatase A-like enzyme
MNNSKSITQSLLIAGLTASYSVSAATKEKVDEPWNFIMILLDDAGWRDLGFAGNNFIETPHMDKIASEGVYFTSAYATHHFSAPTRQSIMSGLYPARTAWTKKSELKKYADQITGPSYSPAGSYKWTKTRPEFISLAEHLKHHGYATGHVGKWHFELHECNVTPESLGFDLNFGGHPKVGAVRDFFAPFEGLPGNFESSPGEYLTDRLTNETISFIRSNKNKPFYVQLWHYAPHSPIMAPEYVVNKYRRKKREGNYEKENPAYAAMLDIVDQGIGRIISTLKELNLDDKTIVILASDNGGIKSFGSVPVTSMYPLRGEKLVVYEGGIKIPMVIMIPGVTDPGSTSNQFVSILDLYPTILDMAGINIPPTQQIDGFSLKPALYGKNQIELDDRIHIWYNPTYGIQNHDGLIFTPVAAIRKNHWKLIKPFFSPLEMYDLKNDPSESVNLAGSMPHLKNRLEFMLDSCLETTGVALPKPNPAFDPDFVLSRQIPLQFFDNKDYREIKNWTGKDLDRWSKNSQCETKKEDSFLRIHSKGDSPQISTNQLDDTLKGIFMVKIKIRASVGGRIRFVWSDEKKNNGVIEFFPERNGEWEELSGIFRTTSTLNSIGLAGPTHILKLGMYEPGVHVKYIDVENIKLFSLE